MATNEKDYNEILLQAMDTLIQHRLQGLEFDRTVKCQIIQDKGQGVFIVKENDSVQYEASATNTVNAPEYKVDDWVYVLIPSGDYSRYKMIVGKYTDDNRNNPVAYVPPLGTVVSMTNNINTVTNSAGILANGDLQVKELGIIDLSTNASADIKYNAIYDTLALTASFKTLFNNVSMVSGNYGLLLRLIEDDGSETAVLLDSSEMFGDPYNYSIYLKQSKAFNISALDNLSKIRVALYQQNNFEYYDESKGENTEYPIDGVAPNNIFVKDIIITLGQDVKTIPDNQFRISVVDGILEYTGSQKKNIRSTWYNKTEDNEFIGFSDGVVDTSYDEDAYMDSYENDWLGMSIKKDDILPVKESLQIYANAQRIEEKTDLINNYLNKDIYSIFQEMANYILSDPEQRDEALKLFTTDIEILEAIKIAEFYKTYLNDCFNYKEPTKETVKSDAKSCCDNIAVSIKNFTGTLNRIKTFLDMVFVPLIKQDMDLSTYVGTQMRRIQPFQNKIEILEKEIIDLCAQSNASPDTKYQEEEEELRKGLIKNLVDRIINDDLIPIEQEYEDFVKANKNKYCIYWYEKDLAAAGDRWVEAGWKRTTDFENGTPGMPVTNEEDTKYPKTSPNPYSYTTDPNLATDSVKAILFYNHIKYESNILEFKNLNPPQDTTQADIADAVYIEHSNNSEGSYQKYNSTYGLVSAVDGLLNRALKVRYDGFAQGDEGLIGTTAYWYVPNQATMLTYDKVKLTGAGYNDLEDIIKSITNTNEQISDVAWKHLAHQRAGFKCFYKDIKQETETEPAKPLESDTLFYYMIAKVFNPAFNQNTIYCVINKDGFDYEGSINFTFSTFGTSGTDYTVSIVPAGTQYAIEPLDPLELEIGFSYLNGLTVDNSPTPVLSWLGPHYNGLEPSTELRLNSIDFTKCLYNVLKCEVQWNNITEDTPADQTLTLSSVYPVALAAGSYYLEGATTVIYNDLGAQPTYYNKKYKLFERHTNNEEDVTWEIIHYDDKGELITDSKILQYAPTLQYVEETAIFKEPGYYLKPLNMYISDSKIYSVIVAKDGDGDILLAQPIYIGQHRWGSSLLNSWNESLTIDEKNGTILSTMIGAGYKDIENAFHGVLMGDVATTVDDKTTIMPGLYGFHAGAQSFAWKVDGTGFIGKSGGGRIEFDGNNGLIKSALWDGTIDTDGSIKKVGTSGMAISLSSGQIDAHDFKLTSGNIYLNSNPTESNKDYYIKIGGNENFLSLSGNKIFQINVPGFNVNSSPGENESYLNIGNNNNYIKFINQGNGSNKLSIAVDDLIITSGLGGTNLLAGTNQGKINWAYSGETGDRSIADDVDKLGVKLTCTTVSNGWSFAIYKPGANSIKKLMPNTKYSLSFYLKSNVAESGTWVSICKSNGRDILVEKTIVLNNIPGDNEWHKYSVVFTTNDLGVIQKATDDEITQGIYFYGFNTVGTRIIKDLKLEQGQNATAWSPAPEDTADAIDKLDQSFDQDKVFDRLTNNRTVEGIFLENGNLYINASYIATGILTSTNDNMKINMDTGQIVADNFALQTNSIQINSEGLPYLKIMHHYKDTNNQPLEEIALEISRGTETTDSCFILNSIPQIGVSEEGYYVYIDGDNDDGSMNYRSGTLNADDGTVSYGGVLGTYEKGARILVTTKHPYKIKNKPSSFMYHTPDDTWFYCASGSERYAIFQTTPPSGYRTEVTDFIAFACKYISVNAAQMSLDIQNGSINIAGGSTICTSVDEENVSWTTVDSKSFKIDVKETTKPFQLGGFSIGWDGQLVGMLNNSRRWYIKPDGGASFSWLYSGSVSCNSLKVSGNDIDSNISNLQKKINSLESDLKDVSGAVDDLEEQINGDEEGFNSLSNEVTSLRISLTQAHDRINRLEGRVSALENA